MNILIRSLQYIYDVLYLTIQFNLQSKGTALSCEQYSKLRDSQINAMFSSRNVSNIIIYTTVQEQISQNKRFFLKIQIHHVILYS